LTSEEDHGCKRKRGRVRERKRRGLEKLPLQQKKKGTLWGAQKKKAFDTEGQVGTWRTGAGEDTGRILFKNNDRGMRGEVPTGQSREPKVDIGGRRVRGKKVGGGRRVKRKRREQRK